MPVILLHVLSDWDRWGVIFGGIAAVGLIVILGFNLHGLWLAGQGVTHARVSNERAEKEMVTRLQAYLGINYPIVPPPDASYIKVGDAVSIVLPVKNYGQWPASKVHISVEAAPDLDEAWELVGEEIHLEGNVIFGGETFPQRVIFSWEQWRSCRIDDNLRMFIVGRVDYFDSQTQKKWRVDACYVMKGDHMQPFDVRIPEEIPGDDNDKAGD